MRNSKLQPNGMYAKIGFPKNEGCTRNFFGRGNAAKQTMDFIVIKFEQAKRAVTTERNDKNGKRKL